MEPYRTETVDTPAGEYTVELHWDQDAENPLTSWDHPGMEFYVFDPARRRDSDVILDTLSSDARFASGGAGDVLKELIYNEFQYGSEGVERRYRKWAAIAQSPWVLVTGEDSASRSDSYRWYVLVDENAAWGNHNEFSAHDYAMNTMETYRKYAAGEFTGFVVKGPDGDEVDALWGIDDEDYAMQQGIEQARWDAGERQEKANLVGAGFVGIV